MNELEERLHAVLSDPGELERLTKTAQQLLGGVKTPEPESGEREGEAQAAGLPAGWGQMLTGLRARGSPPLLGAVGPYLDEGRRRRLERALRLASAARTAGTLWEQMGGLDGL